MMQTLLAVLVLAIVIGIATGAITAQLQKVGEKLGSLEELLAVEFNKEKDYYKEAERSDKEWEEWKKITHGLGPADTIPMPPTPPGIIRVVNALKSINEHLAYLHRLTEAMDKLAGINPS